jgi:hypothetical protein
LAQLVFGGAELLSLELEVALGRRVGDDHMDGSIYRAWSTR